jgi:hypothetical protein
MGDVAIWSNALARAATKTIAATMTMMALYKGFIDLPADTWHFS